MSYCLFHKYSKAVLLLYDFLISSKKSLFSEFGRISFDIFLESNSLLESITTFPELSKI